jgi:adenylosuccinate synthase
VGYRLGAKTIGTIPPTVPEVAALDPVYECRPGWRSSTFGISNYADLPAKARDYLAYLEQQTGVEVGCISTGPERNQTIVRAGSRFAALVG